ncbi:MAG: hypothetical protein ABIZ91_02525 [Gemmatimonadaceae bacterium]
MRHRILLGAGLVVLGMVGTACDKPAPPRSNDTVAFIPPPPLEPDSASPTAESPWDASAGVVFLSAGPNANTAALIFPRLAADAEVTDAGLDVAPYLGTAFDLLGNGRVVSGATLSAAMPGNGAQDCSGWPMVQLAGVAADSAARGWTIAFERGKVLPIAFDSIAGLPSADSSRLAVELARIASGMPGDTLSELRGIPYQVRRAYRFAIAPGVEGILAEIQRTLNQEASPKQEHLLFVAERDSTTRGRYEVAYFERSSGGEEMLESTELLSVARFGPRQDVGLFVARYVGDGLIYSLLQRTGSRRWRHRWSSPYTGC